MLSNQIDIWYSLEKYQTSVRSYERIYCKAESF